MASVPLKQPRETPKTETAEERFRRLAAIWHRETDYLSSMDCNLQFTIARGYAWLPVVMYKTAW